MPYRFIHDRALARSWPRILPNLGGTLSSGWFDTCTAELFQLWVDTAKPELNPHNEEFDYDGVISTWVSDAGLSRDQPAWL